MIIETVGSFLPDEKLIDARRQFVSGIIDRQSLSKVEDESVRALAERQIECNLPYITSGELRRRHWADDFWFGLGGISRERVDSGHVYQPVETAIDHIHVTGRIAFNPQHPFFSDFTFLFNCVDGRGKCRQTLPSPADLLLKIFCLSDGHPEDLYPASESLVSDIAETYRLTVTRLHELGCAAVQFDDTACGLMCDDNFTKRLLQGGVDLLKLHHLLIDVINRSVEDTPAGMETSVYLSGGDKIVPEWEFIRYPDNIMPAILSSLNVDKFFLPFDIGNDYALEILRHVPDDKKVVLGLADAHSPLADNIALISSTLLKASAFIDPSRLAVSHKTGFNVSSYPYRGLTYEDQWRKIIELSAIS